MEVGAHVRFIRSLPTGDKAATTKTKARVRAPENAAGCTMPIEQGTLGVVRSLTPHLRTLGDQACVELIDGTVVEVWTGHLEESGAIDRLGQLTDPLR